ncbi:MAG: zinc ribbon domain-containing protein [Burkholderiaceae bacterium]|nr:zinc ribbon domain-containing protein [Burkholderiaceae bacterium]
METILMQALKPELYALPEVGGEPPMLKGGRCGRCGYTFFPMQAYGCERCGSTELAPVSLVGHGRLVASARVLLHARPERQPPFVVVAVRLDDGPMVRTLLAQDTEEPLPVDTPMATCTVAAGQSESGEPLVDLRFAPEH